MGNGNSKNEQLHFFCSTGEAKKVDKIISQLKNEIKNKQEPSVDINSLIQNTTCLHKALEIRNFEIIRTLLSVDKIRINLTNPAFYSLKKKDKELLKFILEQREFCLHEKNEKKESLLQFIMNNDYEDEFAQIIISLMNPFDFSIPQNSDTLLFLEICETDKINIFKMVLQKKSVNINVVDKTTGNGALMMFVENRQINMLKEFLKYSEVISTNYENRTALHFASIIGDEEICKILLETTNGKLLLNCKDCDHKTPLQLAIENENLHLIPLLSQSLDQDDLKMLSEISKKNEKHFKEIKIDTKLKEPNLQIQVASDLHLEVYDDEKSLDHIIKPSAPYLALLGDIGLPIRKKNYRNFLFDMSEKFKLVFIIAGNHEYYHSSKIEIEAEMKEISKQKENIVYLENSIYILDEIKIIGCVLWSKCSEENKEAVKRINDYNHIKIEPNSENKITVDETIKWHEESLEFIKREIEESKKSDQKCIILTHHAPLKDLGSSEPTFYGSGTNEGFCTDLRYLMGDPILLWAYGHTHWPQDIKIEGTRIVSNPSGYNMNCKCYQKDNCISIYK
eukprot:gene6147-10154_t